MNRTKQPIHNYLKAIRKKTPLLHKDIAALIQCKEDKLGAYESGKTPIPPHILIFYIMICKSSFDQVFRKQTFDMFGLLKENIPTLIEKLNKEEKGRHLEHRLSYLQSFINEMDELYL